MSLLNDIHIGIIEDESFAAKRLFKLIKSMRENVVIHPAVDTIEDAIAMIKEVKIDLLFCDIQLADGLSFSIFNQIEVTCPIIFTTAYDEYAIEAFKVNSIDYLLKPIVEAELARSLDKYDRYYMEHPAKAVDWNSISEAISQQTTDKKKRFLVKKGGGFMYVNVEDISIFYSEDGITLAEDACGSKYIIDYTLDKLESMVDPNVYFRINRKIIISIHAIQKINPYLNQRLKIEPKFSFNKVDLVVSRERVKLFKEWLDS